MRRLTLRPATPYFTGPPMLIASLVDSEVP